MTSDVFYYLSVQRHDHNVVKPNLIDLIEIELIITFKLKSQVHVLAAVGPQLD